LAVSTLSTEPPAVAPLQTLPSSGGNTVQLLLRMPDGKLLQLSALPVENVTPSGGNQPIQPSQVYCYHTQTDFLGFRKYCVISNLVSSIDM
jgi:hypothetical protein